jgi:hypothetical protein
MRTQAEFILERVSLNILNHVSVHSNGHPLLEGSQLSVQNANYLRLTFKSIESLFVNLKRLLEVSGCSFSGLSELNESSVVG